MSISPGSSSLFLTVTDCASFHSSWTTQPRRLFANLGKNDAIEECVEYLLSGSGSRPEELPRLADARRSHSSQEVSALNARASVSGA
ncbi:Hypothetical protein SMAX5B_019275 [Scophthalmus maximus]|nr:Hypothetical protein SMAX5B_019275 [Scophthalmus maximus]